MAFDYHNNIALYPAWQAWLRQHQPPTLVVWGEGDRFFLPAGATAYQRDLPGAELNFLPTGHFALEENQPEVASLIASLLDRSWT